VGAEYVAVAEAQRAAEMARCAACVGDFKHEGSTVAERQQYAECVRLLYPSDSAAHAGLRVAVGGLLVAIIIGAFAGAMHDEYDRFAGAFFGSVIALGVAVTGALAVLAAAFAMGFI